MILTCGFVCARPSSDIVARAHMVKQFVVRLKSACPENSLVRTVNLSAMTAGFFSPLAKDSRFTRSPSKAEHADSTNASCLDVGF